MKFINYLTSIAGVEIFPLISLLVFFTFFIGLGIYVFKADKSYINRLARMPIENMESQENEQNKNV